MQSLPYQKELNFLTSENLVQTWVKWREQFALFLIVTPAAEKAEKVKTSILLACIGEKRREIYSTFEFENEQLKYNLETVIEKFNNYCQPRKNLTFQSAEETRRQTELMTKTPETENIDNVQMRCRKSGKSKHTRNEEDKMADTSKQEDRKQLDKQLNILLNST